VRAVPAAFASHEQFAVRRWVLLQAVSPEFEKGLEVASSQCGEDKQV
jgi:hypothetical protein